MITKFPIDQIGNLTGVRCQPSVLKPALVAAAEIAQVLSNNRGLFANVSTLTQIANTVITAGLNCAGYANGLPVGDSPVMVQKVVFDDFKAMLRFLDQVIEKGSFRSAAEETVKAAFESALGKMIAAYEQFQPINSVSEQYAGMDANSASPANIRRVLVVVAEGVPASSLQPLIQSVVSGAQQFGAAHTLQQNYGRNVEIVLGEDLSVMFQSPEFASSLGHEPVLARHLLNVLQAQKGQWNQMQGVEHFGTNPHQVSIFFPAAQVKVMVTTPKDISTEFGDANQFFAKVEGQIQKYLAQHGTTNMPSSFSNWGRPQFVASSSRTVQSAAANA